MLLEPVLIVELVALGLCTGFLAGLLGIGGGMLMVPFITLIMSARGLPPDLAVKMAIATSMATIVFTSLSSVRAHHRRGAVRWDIVFKLSPGIVLGSMLASMGAFALLKGAWLALFFAGFVGFSATQMLLNKKPAASRTLPGVAGQVASGGVIGFLSGLVGAGGGFVSVPFMTWCNVSMHHAVATSAALGFPIALANTVGYVAAAPDVIRDLTDLKMLGGLTSSELGERVVYKILSEGHYRHHLERLRERLQRSREPTVRSLERIGLKFAPQSASFGGMFLWADAEIDTLAVAQKMAEQEYLVAPGSLFLPNQGPSTWMRFNIATSGHPAALAALERSLARVGGLP